MTRPILRTTNQGQTAWQGRTTYQGEITASNELRFSLAPRISKFRDTECSASAKSGHKFRWPAREEIACARRDRLAPRRSTHTSSARAGREATVVSTKKSTQPVASEITPLVD